MNKKNSGFSLIELLIVIAIVAILVGVVTSMGGCLVASEGDRVGQVTKFSYKGNFHKTWEGELVMGGLRTTAEGATMGNVWEFSVTDDQLVPVVQQAVETQTPVRLHYRQVRFSWPWEASTTYRITGLKPVAVTATEKAK